VDVHVDEARHHRVVAQVHHARARHVDEAVADLGDAVAAHDDAGVARGGWPGTASRVPAWITVTGSGLGAAAGGGLGGGGAISARRGEQGWRSSIDAQ
jgi:hypothetical protein